VHAVHEVATHQTVAAATKDIQARGARDQDVRSPLPSIEEALEECFPPAVLVEFIESNHRVRRGKLIQFGSTNHTTRSRQDGRSVVLVIPVQIHATFANESGFAHLSRTGQKGHLPVFPQVFVKNRIVDARSLHRTILRCFANWSRPFYDGPAIGSTAHRTPSSPRCLDVYWRLHESGD
jgi:hypothetical protein